MFYFMQIINRIFMPLWDMWLQLSRYTIELRAVAKAVDKNSSSYALTVAKIYLQPLKKYFTFHKKD